MTDNKSKRYFWNSNATTHANTVFALTVVSSGIASTVTLAIGAAVFVVVEPTRVQAFVAVLAMSLCWLVMWSVMFHTSIRYYVSLIESQVINPPTDKVIHEKRVYYQTKDDQFKKFK